MKNMIRNLLLLALVSGVNSGQMMAATEVEAPAQTTEQSGLKKVGAAVATNARKAWGGMKRVGEAVKEQLGRKHLKRNLLIASLFAALAAAAQARYDRGLDSAQLQGKNVWRRGVGYLLRGGDGRYDARGRLFGHRAESTADDHAIAKAMGNREVDFDDRFRTYGRALLGRTHAPDSVLAAQRASVNEFLPKRAKQIVDEEAARLGVSGDRLNAEWINNRLSFPPDLVRADAARRDEIMRTQLAGEIADATAAAELAEMGISTDDLRLRPAKHLARVLEQREAEATAAGEKAALKEEIITFLQSDAVSQEEGQQLIRRARGYGLHQLAENLHRKIS